jgi:hypothetical protein
MSATESAADIIHRLETNTHTRQVVVDGVAHTFAQPDYADAARRSLSLDPSPAVLHNWRLLAEVVDPTVQGLDLYGTELTRVIGATRVRDLRARARVA